MVAARNRSPAITTAPIASWQLSARALVREIAEGRRTAVDVVEEHIARLAACAHLNALCCERFAEARAEADLVKDGAEVMVEHLDVSDLTAFTATVEKVVKRWGRLDGIVQNAVAMPLIHFEDTSEESWWRQLRIPQPLRRERRPGRRRSAACGAG